EPLVEIVAGRLGEEIEDHAQIFGRQPAQPVAKLAGSEKLAKASQRVPGREIRRCLQDEIAQHVRAGVDLAVEGVEPLGIPSAEPGHLLLGAPLGGEKMATIERGKEILRTALDDSQAVLVKVQVVNDLRIEQAHRVGSDRVAEPWIKLFRYCCTAHDGPSLKHLDLQPGHAEIGGADEAVVPSANDDGVMRSRRRHCSVRWEDDMRLRGLVLALREEEGTIAGMICCSRSGARFIPT